MARFLPLALLALAALLFPPAIHRMFLETPMEAQLGTAQRIFYFHVPVAWSTMLFATISGIAAGVQLRGGGARAAALALATGEATVVCGAAALGSGMIWGDASWGTPWTGDPRLVSTALLWVIFVAYVLVRHFGAGASDRIAAALAIFGAVDVPIIYYAAKVKQSTHPRPTVVKNLPSEMWSTLWQGLAPLLALLVALVIIRVAQVRAQSRLDAAWRELDQPA